MSENMFIATLRISGKGISGNTAANVAIHPFRIDGDCLHYSVAEDAKDFDALIDATRNFLDQNKSAVQRLMATDGVAGGILDLGTSLDIDKAAQFLRFPNAVLSLLNELGLALEISIYH